MNRLRIWIIFPLLFFAQTLVAQHSNTPKHLPPLILSSSGFEKIGQKKLNFSIGFIKSVLVLDASENHSQETESLIAGKTALNMSFGAQGIPDKTVHILAFPNPFIDQVTLSIQNFSLENESNYQFKLFDLTGHILHLGPVVKNQKKIALSFLPKGVYFLLLYKNGKEIKSIKLIKSNR